MAASPMSEVVQHLRRTVLLQDGLGLTDEQLLASYLSRRDEAALAALVRRHGSMVWGVCRRILANYHDAEDAFQATFLVLVRKAPVIASPELLANWLYGVAHQTALKARATAAKRRARETQAPEQFEPAISEPDLWWDLQPLLDRELSRLPDRYRIAIVLCDLEGKTRKEAARQLGVPDGTLAARVARGRALLAKRLARHGLAVSGGTLAAVLELNAASASAPSAVTFSTIKAASLFAVGQAGAGMISAPVAALTEGVLKAMSMTKLKIASAFLLALLLVAAGAEVLSQAARGQPLPAAKVQTAKPATQEDPLKNTLLILDKAIWDAVATGDPTAVQKLYADDFVSYSKYGRFNKKQSVASVPNYRCKDIQIRNVELHRVSKEVAILTYIYSTNVYTAGGTLDGVRRDHRISNCRAQRDGGWVLVSMRDIVMQGGE